MKSLIGKILSRFVSSHQLSYLIQERGKTQFSGNFKTILPRDGKWHQFTLQMWIKEGRSEKKGKKNVLVDDIALIDQSTSL